MRPESPSPLGSVPHDGASDRTLIDCSTAVNPERPPGVAGVYESALATARRPPADDYCELRAAAADRAGCNPSQVIPVAGGHAARRLAVDAAVDAGDSVLLPTPATGTYAHEATLRGADPTFVPRERLFDADPSDHALVVVRTPDDPTGAGVDEFALRAFAERCRRAGATLLVDETYLGFTDRDSLAGAAGAVVVRSPARLYGLPGLRAAFLVATGDLRDRLDAARPAWNVGVPAAQVLVHAMGETAFVRETRERVVGERARLRDRLETAYGVAPSEAPFLLLDVGDRSVDAVRAEARAAGVAVRDATEFRGLDSHVRVAVRRPAENDRLLDALGV